MRSIIGIDLRPDSQGPLKLGAWLESQWDEFEVTPVRVVEPMADVLVGYQPLEQLFDLEKSHAEELCEGLALKQGPEVIERPSAVVGLTEIAQKQADSLIVIGRLAASGEDRLTRLGRVARRLLRELPTPVMVTPPDLDLDQVKSGPILLATDAETDSDEAAQFAKKWAAGLGRPIELAHIVPMPLSWGTALSVDVMDKVSEGLIKAGREATDAWREKQSLDVTETHIRCGDIAYELLNLAKERNASWVICGSRRLSLASRIFSCSMGTELAAAAEVPTIVVPPPQD